MFRRVFSLIKQNFKANNEKSLDPKVSIYKKTEAFDVPKHTNVNLKPHNIKIDNIEPEFVKLNKKQQHLLIRYMKESYELYQMNEIHIDSDLLKAFHKIELSIDRNETILKYWVDLVLHDMDKSNHTYGSTSNNFYSLDDEIIF